MLWLLPGGNGFDAEGDEWVVCPRVITVDQLFLRVKVGNLIGPGDPIGLWM